MLGYLHWFLLDNFEWQEGYAKTFGLIAVDRTTQARKPKESLKYLGEMASMHATVKISRPMYCAMSGDIREWL